jgi:DnaK suppressor protein
MVDTVTARERLEHIRDEIERSIAVLIGEHEPDQADDGSPQDAADAGSNLTETDRSRAMLSFARMQRSEVLDALHRIEHGTYGRCADCGTEVPEGRLEAKPEAARCVACQAKRDRARR